jgi:hypothetical protein
MAMAAPPDPARWVDQSSLLGSFTGSAAVAQKAKDNTITIANNGVENVVFFMIILLAR